MVVIKTRKIIIYALTVDAAVLTRWLARKPCCAFQIYSHRLIKFLKENTQQDIQACCGSLAFLASHVRIV